LRKRDSIHKDLAMSICS